MPGLRGWQLIQYKLDPYQCQDAKYEAGWATVTVAIVGLVASLFVPMPYCCGTGCAGRGNLLMAVNDTQFANLLMYDEQPGNFAPQTMVDKHNARQCHPSQFRAHCWLLNRS